MMKHTQFRRELFGLLVSMLAALAAILCAVRIWEMDLNLLLDFQDDEALGTMLFKSIYENGLKGWFFCDRLGAPGISTLIDTPFFDFDLAFEAGLLSLFLPSAMAVYNVLYFLSYPLAAGAMYLLLGRFTKKIPLKIMLSVAYAVTPYHFYRNLHHITLSQYFVIPIVIWLAFLIAEEPFKGIVPARFQTWKAAVMYLSCVLIGFANVYYVFFGLFCMGIAFVYKLVQKKKLSCVRQDGMPLFAVLASFALTFAPQLIYGRNYTAYIRYPYETEIYALKPMQMLMPADYSKVKEFASMAGVYKLIGFNVNENRFSALGILASIGFLTACVWIISRLITANASGGTDAKRLNFLSLCILSLVLYCIGGGFGSIVAYTFLTELRCLNRSSIVIACLCLCVLAIVLNFLLDRFKAKKWRIGISALLACVFAFSIYAEVDWKSAGWQSEMKQNDQLFRQFFGEVEAAMDEGDMIYELPYMEFPEAGAIYNMSFYQPVIGYLYTDTLRWSYGAMSGRDDTAKTLYADDGISKEFVQSVKDAGFSGIYIDTMGYKDEGEEIIAFYSETLGLTPIVSEGEWLYFYNIKDAVLS